MDRETAQASKEVEVELHPKVKAEMREHEKTLALEKQQRKAEVAANREARAAKGKINEEERTQAAEEALQA